ncbi:hypothetical protein [Glutamicibacter mysorens]|uniref:hypothetical protein n=1 Tax=Glutamicibacter mysorens TaxID=257984 RepID=UPI0034643BF6
MDTDRDRLLRLYDEQLRTDAETPGAQSITRLGPLRLATYAKHWDSRPRRANQS